jgi:hypothetical protein
VTTLILVGQRAMIINERAEVEMKMHLLRSGIRHHPRKRKVVSTKIKKLNNCIGLGVNTKLEV